MVELPCYNGLYLQVANADFDNDFGCNPCYNGLYLQDSERELNAFVVVILVIMDCIYRM